MAKVLIASWHGHFCSLAQTRSWLPIWTSSPVKSTIWNWFRSLFPMEPIPVLGTRLLFPKGFACDEAFSGDGLQRGWSRLSFPSCSARLLLLPRNHLRRHAFFSSLKSYRSSQKIAWGLWGHLGGSQAEAAEVKTPRKEWNHFVYIAFDFVLKRLLNWRREVWLLSLFGLLLSP